MEGDILNKNLIQKERKILKNLLTEISKSAILRSEREEKKMTITQNQARDMMNEIAFAIIRTDFDKYIGCTEEQCEVLNSYVRPAFVSICEILGIEEVEEN